ncbi:GntR family transcriptional regulator [Mesorhizobium salmacidum]|uniref:GntR family transcriptional regulator n=1 Tax=Mesorhizobium salmacidum TaxID=3015171 RepID=UPI0039F587A3
MSGYRYRALAEAIRAAVRSGELAPGERLLSHRHMAWKAGVTIATVARAYQIAGEWGVVYSKVGHGTRVREAADSRRPLVLREESNHTVNFGLLLATPLTESALRKTGLHQCVCLHRYEDRGTFPIGLCARSWLPRAPRSRRSVD